MAILGAWIAVTEIRDERLRWSAFVAFVVLGFGLLALEQMADIRNERKAKESQEKLDAQISSLGKQLVQVRHEVTASARREVDRVKSLKNRATLLSSEILELVAQYRLESGRNSNQRFHASVTATSVAERDRLWADDGMESSRLHDRYRTAYTTQYAAAAASIANELKDSGYQDDELLINVQYYTNMLGIEQVGLRLGSIAERIP